MHPLATILSLVAAFLETYAKTSATLIEVSKTTGGRGTMAQQQLRKEFSTMEALLYVREKNRRVNLEEYLQKIGLGEEFHKFLRKKNSQAP